MLDRSTMFGTPSSPPFGSRNSSESSVDYSPEDDSMQDNTASYGDMTSRLDRLPRSSLEIWLHCRGLESCYEALRAMGAKRVSDLAHLTPEDHKALGLSEAQAKLVTINVVG